VVRLQLMDDFSDPKDRRPEAHTSWTSGRQVAR